MSDRSSASNPSSREISRPAAAQEVGDLAFAASFLAGLLEEGSASEDAAELARGLQEHLRDLEDALSGRPTGSEEGPHEGNPKEKTPPEGNPETPAEPTGDRPAGRGKPDRKCPERDKEGLGAALRRRFEVPINPNPGFKPPLAESTELELSPETVRTLERASSALSPFYNGQISKNLVVEVALRQVLYEVATEREESILAEWLSRAHGRKR